MKDLKIIVDNLAEFAHDKNLVARAFDSCLLFLNDEAKAGGLPRQISPSEIDMRFRSHSLTFESSLHTYPYITTRLDLFVVGEEVGWYQFIVRLDGQADDDYLVFYPEQRG